MKNSLISLLLVTLYQLVVLKYVLILEMKLFQFSENKTQYTIIILFLFNNTRAIKLDI